MIMNVHGNPKTTLRSCYSPVNVSDDTDIFDKIELYLQDRCQRIMY